MDVPITRQRVRKSVPLDAAMPDGSPSFGALLFGQRLGPASVMRPRWPWRRGPKRGIAQGVAMLSEPGWDRAENAEELAASLGRQDELEGWLAQRGDALTDSPEDLAIVDSAIDGWTKHPTIGPALGNVVGLFLGSVLVRHVDGAVARLAERPSGRPPQEGPRIRRGGTGRPTGPDR